jgi:excisionase family DNA binding protein
MTETTTAPQADQLHTVREAADKLRVSKSQVYMLIRAGILDAIRLTSHTGAEGAIRIKQSAIDAYLAGASHAAPSP